MQGCQLGWETDVKPLGVYISTSVKKNNYNNKSYFTLAVTYILHV